LIFDTRYRRALLKIVYKALRLVKIPSGIVWSVDKEFVEEISAPFNAMLNLVGEVA